MASRGPAASLSLKSDSSIKRDPVTVAAGGPPVSPLLSGLVSISFAPGRLKAVKLSCDSSKRGAAPAASDVFGKADSGFGSEESRRAD